MLDTASGLRVGNVKYMQLTAPLVTIARVLFLITGLCIIPVVTASAQLTVRYQPVELELIADEAYEHPHRDVQVGARFEGPGGQVTTVAGFWDGDRTYRIRFAPPSVGMWTYRTTSSNPDDRGLHGRVGTIEVAPNPSDDPFARHGWLRASDDRRYLTHADGIPFFYLGDTAWEITWKSTRDEVRAYLDDREQKGFTAIQLVVMSHQLLYDYGVRNRDGEPFFRNDDFSMLNPRYFDYLDWIVEEINDRGMVAALVPLWAYMTDLYPETGPQRDKLSEEDAHLLARYVGARYAGHNVLWIVGGDNRYDTPERKAFWASFARTLRAASGDSQHLATVHPHGFGASFDYFDASEEWIDFHMYQSSHVAGGDYTWRAAARGFALDPHKPVLNGEATYEDIYHRLWQPGDTTEALTFRIRSEHVRQASYESVLNGALVGMAYGANGVWQWHKEELPGSHQPRFPVLEAIQLEGSSHMAVLKRLMTELRWYRLRPAQEVILEKEGEEFLPVARSGDTLVVYVPMDVQAATLAYPDDVSAVEAQWIDPRSGDALQVSDVAVAEGEVTLQKPEEGDWLVVLAPPGEVRLALPEEEDALLPTPLEIYNHPNPYFGETNLRVQVGEPGEVTVTVWNAVGRRVATKTQSVPAGGGDIPLRVSAAGLYLYRTVFESATGARTQVQGTMMCLGE